MNESLIQKLRIVKNSTLAAICASLIYPLTGSVAAPPKKVQYSISPFAIERFEPNEFNFIRDLHCKAIQYSYVGEREDFNNINLIRPYIKQFDEEMRKKEYLPSKELYDYLVNFENGENYEVDVAEKGVEESRWLRMHYRNANEPEPFIRGITLLQPATNVEFGKVLGEPFIGSDNFFMLDAKGSIDFVVSIGPEGCVVRSPKQLLIRGYIIGEKWEEHNYAKAQKTISRFIENIAENLTKHGNVASSYLSNQLSF
jgi:hypothetical protein